MSSNNPNLFTLNPKFFQTTSNNFYSCLNNISDDFSSVKTSWIFEKTQLQVFSFFFPFNLLKISYYLFF